MIKLHRIVKGLLAIWIQSSASAIYPMILQIATSKLHTQL